MKRTRERLEQARQKVREYAGDLSVGEIRRLFDRDAVEAYERLARDHAGREPEEPFERSVHRLKVFFVGISSKLSPARRVLFTLGVALVVWSVFDLIVDVTGDSDSPALLLLAALIFLFLFAMEVVDRLRVRDELEVAKELQSGLLPEGAPRIGGYRFAHSYRTANEVGGDYYDFLPLPDGRLALVVGDASGHGMAAGLLMAIANATLKTALDVSPEPAQVLTILNRSLCRTGSRRAFMTLFYAVLTPEDGRLDYVCAGHPFPLLRRADGRIEELGRGGLPLGMKSDLDIRVLSTRLEPGDLLLLYSDGMVEAVSGDRGAFGFDRLRELLATAASPRAVHDRIRTAFDRFLDGEPLTDDLTLVVLARDAVLPPPPAGD
ncbi:MAG: PP2C family protein-serine/threonine phosphatase [Thermoanaerobaculia bacterium]|nr:PP2C family protein-serine/threonine phosphatase [Thermoanaerobaculia bacterium]